MHPIKKKCRKHFDPETDLALFNLVQKHGMKWGIVSKHLKNWTPRQCRDRYLNYLRPEINTSKWDPEEDERLCKLVEKFGTKWASIVPYFNNRTQVNIKNRYANISGNAAAKMRTVRDNAKSNILNEMIDNRILQNLIPSSQMIACQNQQMLSNMIGSNQQMMNQMTDSNQQMMNQMTDSNQQMMNQMTGSNQQMMNQMTGSNQQMMNYMIESNQQMMNHMTSSNQQMMNQMTNSNQQIMNQMTNSNQQMMNHMTNSNQKMMNQMADSNHNLINHMIETNQYRINQINESVQTSKTFHEDVSELFSENDDLFKTFENENMFDDDDLFNELAFNN